MREPCCFPLILFQWDHYSFRTLQNTSNEEAQVITLPWVGGALKPVFMAHVEVVHVGGDGAEGGLDDTTDVGTQC